MLKLEPPIVQPVAQRYTTELSWHENLKGRNHLGDRGAGERVTLGLILKKQGVRVWAGFI
jgi:hypothetical protein